MPDLLSDLRDYLITQGLVRKPSVAGSASPFWLEPRNGVPAPGEGQNATERGDPVLGAYLTGGVAARPFESSLRESVVDIHFRSQNPAQSVQTHRQLRAALIDRRQQLVGTQVVIDIEEWRPFQRLGSDEQGWTHIWAIWAQTYSTNF